MSRTYKATGINLKSMPLGETDRLVTVLTSEYGLVRAVAPGARKHKSRLRGRIEIFVVNELSIVKGRSLDKIIQADTIESYPGLSKDLSKLAASQYLAEVVLGLGLSEQPQVELYELLNEHLRRLEQLPCGESAALVLSHLAHGLFHLLALTGFGPQVHRCCSSGRSLVPNLSDPHWQVQFSFEAGGIIHENSVLADDLGTSLEAFPSGVQTQTQANRSVKGLELVLLQQLAEAELAQPDWGRSESELSLTALETSWFAVERLLRHYTQYHLGKSIRSAALLDTLFISEF
jgi:DNA repair protein RecO (recombination protein O)